MSLDFSIVIPYFPMFLKGTKATIEASTLAILIGLAIGTIVGIGRVIPSKPINLIAWLYVYVIRGTPLLVQLLWLGLLLSPNMLLVTRICPRGFLCLFYL